MSAFEKLKELAKGKLGDPAKEVEFILDEEVQNLIPEAIKEWIKKKPYEHLYDGIVVCAKASPLTLQFIITERMDRGGFVSKLFTPHPHSIEAFHQIFPLDIFLYAVRIDKMRYPQLKLDQFFEDVKKTKAFMAFPWAVAQFVVECMEKELGEIFKEFKEPKA